MPAADDHGKGNIDLADQQPFDRNIIFQLPLMQPGYLSLPPSQRYPRPPRTAPIMGAIQKSHNC